MQKIYKEMLKDKYSLPLNSVGCVRTYSSCNLTPIFLAPSWRIEKLFTAEKMMFFVKNVSSKCEQIRRKLQIWSYLLKKYFMENFIFCAVCFRYTCKRKNMMIKLLYEVKDIAASQKSLNSYVIMCEMIHNLNI